jgi:hypothetical protein
MDVTEWLRSRGLGQYASAFEQNHISPELLPSLSGDDLKGLGVASLGHRRAMLAAIADLRAGPAAAADVSAPEPAAGSAALSARLDPEELSEVIGAYHTALSPKAVAGTEPSAFRFSATRRKPLIQAETRPITKIPAPDKFQCTGKSLWAAFQCTARAQADAAMRWANAVGTAPMH